MDPTSSQALASFWRELPPSVQRACILAERKSPGPRVPGEDVLHTRLARLHHALPVPVQRAFLAALHFDVELSLYFSNSLTWTQPTSIAATPAVDLGSGALPLPRRSSAAPGSSAAPSHHGVAQEAETLPFSPSESPSAPAVRAASAVHPITASALAGWFA